MPTFTITYQKHNQGFLLEPFESSSPERQYFHQTSVAGMSFYSGNLSGRHFLHLHSDHEVVTVVLQDDSCIEKLQKDMTEAGVNYKRTMLFNDLVITFRRVAGYKKGAVGCQFVVEKKTSIPQPTFVISPDMN